MNISYILFKLKDMDNLNYYPNENGVSIYDAIEDLKKEIEYYIKNNK